MTDGLGWEVRTLADAFAPRPPQGWAIPGIVPVPSIIVGYGPPGVLKSLLWLDASLCVAAGLPWLEPLPGEIEPLPKPTTALPVLWLDFDNGQRRTAERIEAVATGHKLDPASVPFSWVSMPDPWLDCTDAAAMRGLARLIKDHEARLAVLDNLAAVSLEARENTDEMSRVTTNVRRLVEATEIALVLIHHPRKTTAVKARPGEMLRGWSGIEGALDLALAIERDGQSPDVLLASTKTRGVDVAPFGARFTYTHKPGTTELETARFFGWPVLSAMEQAERAIVKALQDQPDSLSKGALAKAAQADDGRLGVNRLRDAIDRLTERGTLTMTSGPRNAHQYTLPLRE